MPSSPSARELPTAIRVCRSLLWAQAAYLLFSGIFVLLATVILGGTIPFRGGSVSGSAAAMLGAVYVLAALTLTWLGVALGRRETWTRPAIASAEVFIIVVQLVRSFEMSVSTVVTAALVVAILALLLLGDAEHSIGAANG
jgi:hypothetical protein